MSGLILRDQLYVGSGSPDAAAKFQVDSTSQGSLPWPRMTTTQRDTISNPPTGMTVYNTTTNQVEVNAGTPGSPSWAAVGGGAPSSAELLTTAANGSLSAEVVIPGLAGSPDIEGAGGGGFEREFDNSGGAAATWDTSPLNEDFDTTAKSHWYVEFDNTTANRKRGVFTWSPGSGAFDARMKIMGGLQDGAAGSSIGLEIADSGASNRLLVDCLMSTSTPVIRAFTFAASTYTQRGSSQSYLLTEPLWLRIVRDGSNNITFFYSRNGLIWHRFAAQALTLTVDNIGLDLFNGTASTAYALVDWIRTDV